MLTIPTYELMTFLIFISFTKSTSNDDNNKDVLMNTKIPLNDIYIVGREYTEQLAMFEESNGDDNTGSEHNLVFSKAFKERFPKITEAVFHYSKERFFDYFITAELFSKYLNPMVQVVDTSISMKKQSDGDSGGDMTIDEFSELISSGDLLVGFKPSSEGCDESLKNHKSTSS